MTSLMRAISAFSALAVFAICSACSGETDVAANVPGTTSPTDRWSVYEGAWFTVDYPESFDVVPSLGSDTAQGYDSVFFQSADGRVKFYAMCPQWGRRATDIAVEPDAEFENKRIQHDESGHELVETVIRSKDNSYIRELEEHFAQDGTVYWAFQFTYVDEPAREAYAETYQKFKASLKRFSD